MNNTILLYSYEETPFFIYAHVCMRKHDGSEREDYG